MADVELPAVDVVDPDGADVGEPVAPGPNLSALATATRARFEPVPAPPDSAHSIVCDAVPFGGALYVAHSEAPVVADGAQVHRYAPDDGWSVALDYFGQGFTRIRVIDDRLYVPDADTPGPGYGLSDARFEEYLWISEPDGAFADPPEVRVLPHSFHAFDVAQYRGSLVVTGGTGVIRPGQWGPFPGGLFAAEPDAREIPNRFTVGRRAGVVRSTYLHRFKGRLYVGFQNNERRARWDVGVLSGAPLDGACPEPVLARITPDGGWLTQRFASSGGTLYWIASGYPNDGRGSQIYASTDGQRFERVEVPSRPHSIAFVGDTRYILAEDGLYRGETRLADAPDGDPFGRFDWFCSAPLVVFDDALYAGSTRDGRLYRVVASR